MLLNATFSDDKNAKKFRCEICNFNCCKKSNFDKHITTPKHQKATICYENATTLEAKNAKCPFCEKDFKHTSSMYRHKKTCSFIQDEPCTESPVEENNSNLIEYLMKENSELKNMILDVCKNMNLHNTHNSHNTTNSHNKAFNLNVFLNETCKDAMNINDFVESIKLQVSDLENVGEVGFVEGISNIIVKNLNALDITKRPVHCTDKKRETIYIKDENVWEKDESQCKIRRMIKKVVSKNQRLIPKFKEQNPEYNKSSSKVSDKYNKLIIESMGGSGDNDAEKEDKIVRNIVKNVVVDKCL